MFIADEVQNFMETLVEEEFQARGLAGQYDNELLQDLFCLVLNQLKPRYLRHSIDVRINMSEQEREKTAQAIHTAIERAEEVVHSGRRVARDA